MLNPNLDNFDVKFSTEMFPKNVSEPYDRFLHQFNSPVKNIIDAVHESIVDISIPGLNIPEITIAGLNNTGPRGINSQTLIEANTKNIDYISNVPFDEVIDSKLVNINFRNTIINWMYFNHMFRLMFNRNKDVKEFRITLTMKDPGDIPMIVFIFDNCIIKSFPELTFSHSLSINEAANIQVGFRFNNLSYKFILPNFDMEPIKIF